MKFCSKCGNEIMEDAVICPNCGCATGKPVAVTNDSPSFGLWILGFFVPLAGFIVFLATKSHHPLRAKSAGKGALTSVILSVIGYVIYFVAIIALAGSIGGGAYYY